MVQKALASTPAEKRPQMMLGSPVGHSCGGQLWFVQQYPAYRWCDRCRAYIPWPGYGPR